jgi:hypothetical protein
MNDEAWREPSKDEKRVLELLLSADFKGRDELQKQVNTARVRTIDREGSISFEVKPDTAPASVEQRVPAETMYRDEDGVPVGVLLHVVDGRLHEMEVYKADGSDIKVRPAIGLLAGDERAPGVD